MKLLQHFKELTVNPKNAQELKGLILELALRGRLTNSFSTDRQKKQKNIVEGYYELPEDWYWDKFDNISDFQMGKTPPSKEMEYWEGSHPWISIADMHTYSTITNTKKTLSDKGLNDYFKSGLVKKGTLIMSFKLTIGKTSILGVDACHNEAIISIYPKEKVLQEYLFLFLPVISHWGVQVNALMGKTLNKGKIQNMNIPIPPLVEQKEIVNVVETLFKEVEQLEQLTVERISLKEDFVTSALNQLTTNNANQEWTFLQDHFKSFFNETTNIKKLRETVLQLVVQGKLTADWRSRHPELVSGSHHASQLLKRIQEEKAQLIKDKKIKKEKALPKITKDEIPYELPDGWVWCRMGEIAEKLGAGSTPSGGKSTYVDEGIKFFRSQNIYNTYLKLDQVAYITDTIHEKMKGTKVKPKDILLNITGGSIGRCSLIPDDFDTANVSQHVAIVRMIELETRKYIHQFITSKGFQDRIMDVQVGVSREGLSMTKLKMFPTPLPPLEEQKAIVEKVNALMGLCDNLEQEVQQSQAHSEMLMQSCLREVFEGERKKEEV